MATTPKTLDLLLGRPLATSEERAEQIGPVAGIPIFGLDALSSAAYRPEAALTLLFPLGLMGVKEIVPISAAILTLLIIVYFSYRQSIEAYPHGSGSFTAPHLSAPRQTAPLFPGGSMYSWPSPPACLSSSAASPTGSFLLCHWRVPGIYSFATRDGGALAAKCRRQIQDGGQWSW